MADPKHRESLETHWATKLIRDSRKRLSEMAEEPEGKRKHREHLGECHACFYVRGSRISGQAFTEYECRSCKGKFQHPNTSVPKLCEACAKDSNRCRRCMADLTAVAAEATEGKSK